MFRYCLLVPILNVNGETNIRVSDREYLSKSDCVLCLNDNLQCNSLYNFRIFDELHQRFIRNICKNETEFVFHYWHP